MSHPKKRVAGYQTTSIAGIAAISPKDDGAGAESTGLTILGTEVGCGKTAFMTGMTAALRQIGTPARAIKPLCFGLRDRCESELSFISSITGTPRNYSPTIVQSAKNLTSAQWSQAISVCLNNREATMVETPASVASALIFEQAGIHGLTHGWKDSTNFAAELHLPVIIVAKHNDQCIERIVLAWSYAKTLGLTVAGTVTVETSPTEGKALEDRLSRSEVSLLLNSRTQVPYLGCLKYSPSISVQRVNQGNLVKMTEQGIDMLAIRQALEPAVAK